MNLDLSQIKGPRDRFRRNFQGTEVGPGGGDQYTVVDTVTLDLEVRKDGTKYLVVGRLDATLELECCRCLEPVRRGVDLAVDLMYLPASENSREGEVKLEESDLRTAFYVDSQIDLGQLMHEQFQLALPMKPLCGDDCRGLCAVCGGNRNKTACQCVETWADPRLAVLKRLLNQ